VGVFLLQRLFLKLLWLADFLVGPVYKFYLLLFKGVDISLLADVRPHHFRNLHFGRRTVIGQRCVLAASGRGRIRLASGVTIEGNTQLLNYGGKDISVGPGTSINKSCILYGHGGLRIGGNCLIGPHCVLVPCSHNFDDPARNINQQGETCRGIAIGNNCWLGAGVIVLDGVTIGDNCVIGANSTVTRSIPPNSVAAGTPARVIKQRGEEHVAACEHPGGSFIGARCHPTGFLSTAEQE
jgi:acetyltransferase-like isoleucine patch superfamily enzyme